MRDHPAGRHDVRADGQLRLAGGAPGGEPAGTRAARRSGAAAAFCGGACPAAAAKRAKRAGGKGARQLFREEGVHGDSRLLRADVPRAFPRFVCVRRALSAGAGVHRALLHASSAFAHAAAGRLREAGAGAGQHQPRRGAVQRGADDRPGGVLCGGLRVDRPAERRARGQVERGVFRGVSAAHDDGRERDEGRALLRLVRADAGACSRGGHGAADGLEARRGHCRGRRGHDAAAQQRAVRGRGVGLAAAGDVQAARAENGGRGAAGHGAVYSGERRAEGGDTCRRGRPVRDALLADPAAGAGEKSARRRSDGRGARGD